MGTAVALQMGCQLRSNEDKFCDRLLIKQMNDSNCYTEKITIDFIMLLGTLVEIHLFKEINIWRQCHVIEFVIICLTQRWKGIPWPHKAHDNSRSFYWKASHGIIVFEMKKFGHVKLKSTNSTRKCNELTIEMMSQLVGILYLSGKRCQKLTECLWAWLVFYSNLWVHQLPNPCPPRNSKYHVWSFAKATNIYLKRSAFFWWQLGSWLFNIAQIPRACRKIIWCC